MEALDNELKLRVSYHFKPGTFLLGAFPSAKTPAFASTDFIHTILNFCATAQVRIRVCPRPFRIVPPITASGIPVNVAKEILVVGWPLPVWATFAAWNCVQRPIR